MVGFISFHFGLRAFICFHFGLRAFICLFWPFEPSFPLVLSFWAFIAFHFGLFLFVCLGLGHFLRASAGSTVVWAYVSSAVLPRSFRAASAKHRSKTGKCRDRCFSFIDALQKYIKLNLPSATFREANPSARLPRPSAA